MAEAGERHNPADCYSRQPRKVSVNPRTAGFSRANRATAGRSGEIHCGHAYVPPVAGKGAIIYGELQIFVRVCLGLWN